MPEEIDEKVINVVKEMQSTVADTHHDLIINLDQTPLPSCLVNQYAMVRKESKQGMTAGSADHW